MTFIVGEKHMNLQKSIAVTCSTLIILALSGNGLSVLAAETQPANKTFGDWCREKASLSPEAQHTIEVLLQQAETTNCAEANERLSTIEELQLDENKISDLKPLQSLTKLTLLSLMDNKISGSSGFAV